MRLENKLLSSVKGKDNDTSVKGIWIGLHWSAVEGKYIGMSHTYKTSQKVYIQDAGELSSFSVGQLADRLLSREPLEASIGAAALNSFIEPKGTKGSINSYIKKNARNKIVTIIGRFPFNNEISKIARKTYLLEMEPEKDELPASAAEEILPSSELNVITATALINHTLQRLLELGDNGINIILGPSTPLSPILFDFGADILAGVEVYNKDAIVKSITQGAKKFQLLNGLEPICLYNKKIASQK